MKKPIRNVYNFVAHYFKDFGITKGVVGLEYAFLPAPRMGMFTHPHAKPGKRWVTHLFVY